jgi:hypothetical protein
MVLALPSSAIDEALRAYQQWQENPRAFWPPTSSYFADCLLTDYSRLAPAYQPFTLLLHGASWGASLDILVKHLLTTVFQPFSPISSSPYFSPYFAIVYHDTLESLTFFFDTMHNTPIFSFPNVKEIVI